MKELGIFFSRQAQSNSVGPHEVNWAFQQEANWTAATAAASGVAITPPVNKVDLPVQTLLTSYYYDQELWLVTAVE